MTKRLDSLSPKERKPAKGYMLNTLRVHHRLNASGDMVRSARLAINRGAWHLMGTPDHVDVYTDVATNQIKIDPQGATGRVIIDRRGGPVMIYVSGLRRLPPGDYVPLGDFVYEHRVAMGVDSSGQKA